MLLSFYGSILVPNLVCLVPKSEQKQEQKPGTSGTKNKKIFTRACDSCGKKEEICKTVGLGFFLDYSDYPFCGFSIAERILPAILSS